MAAEHEPHPNHPTAAEVDWHDRDHSMETDDVWHDHGVAEDAPQHAHGQTSPLGIFLTGVLSLAVLSGLIIGTMIYFTQAVRRVQVERLEVTPINQNVLAARAMWQAGLTGYGWVDGAKGVVRLPLEQAVEIVAEEYTLKP
jgi:hypothetical protein